MNKQLSGLSVDIGTGPPYTLIGEMRGICKGVCDRSGDILRRETHIGQLEGR